MENNFIQNFSNKFENCSNLEGNYFKSFIKNR